MPSEQATKRKGTALETLHHAIMSERWAKSLNMPDEMISELIFWSMAPDLYLKVVGYGLRPATHCEEPGHEGCALHKTREDLSALDARSLEEGAFGGLSETARLGYKLHLVQDREYDKWIGQWVSARRDEASGEWEYLRADTGKSVSWTEVALLKRWSWRCAWIQEVGDALTKTDMLGETFPECLARYEKLAQESPHWTDEMEGALRELWQVEMVQEHSPSAFADAEDEMLRGLMETWEVWKKEI